MAQGVAEPTIEAGSERVYTRPLLLMLLLAYTTNFMDRTIVGTLAQAIKVDLKITDSQLGLLQGFAFVILYSFVGVPMARLAERRDRITIISVCLAAWSGMTMLCGAAQNFAQLLLFRIGVGVGEAGCNPCSHSMIADAFSAKRRASALAVYTFGVPLGTMIGAMSGGLIAEHLSWRMAFVIVGAPGLLLALAMRLFLRDPPRVSPPPTAAEVQSSRVSQVARRLLGSPALRHLILGFTLTSFTGAGISSFSQPYFIRVFDLSYAQIGLVFGFFGGLAAGASILISGRLSDWTAQRDTRWHAWLPAIGVALSLPLSALAFTAGRWEIALAWLTLSGLFMNWFIAPTLSAVHKLTGERIVATAMALILLFQNLVGLGGGPYFTGVLIDFLSQRTFTLDGLGDFNALCPGGVAAAGSAPALATACHASLADATRTAIMITVIAKAWAVVHFVLAAAHVRRELAAVAGKGGA